MPISSAYENSATIGTTLYSLPNNSTTLTPINQDGVYQVFIDFSAMTITEQYEVTVYETIVAAGAQRKIYQAVLTGSATSAVTFPPLMLLHGWDVQVRKLAGTDRSISWSIRRVI